MPSKMPEKKKVATAQDRCSHKGRSYVGAAFSPWEMSGPSAASMLVEITRRATAALERLERVKQITAELETDAKVVSL